MKALKPKSIAKMFLNVVPMLIVAATLLFVSLSFNTGNQLNSGDISVGGIKLVGGTCGGGTSQTPAVSTSINFGCTGSGNPITDLIFAIIRFLSAGVGLVIIASVIVGGIQYILSRGDPSATQKAVNRLVTSVVALIIFIFAYAILNYIIPGGFFNP